MFAKTKRNILSLLKAELSALSFLESHEVEHKKNQMADLIHMRQFKCVNCDGGKYVYDDDDSKWYCSSYFHEMWACKS